MYKKVASENRALSPAAVRRESARRMGTDYDTYLSAWKKPTAVGATPPPIVVPKTPVIQALKATPKSAFDTVGSDELATAMRTAERERQVLDSARFNKKGNLNTSAGWNPDTYQAWQRYTEGNNKAMNLLKRDPRKFDKQYGDDWIDIIGTDNEYLEGLFEHSATSSDVTVARGMTGNFGNLKVGQYMSDPGFLSTTTDLAEAQNFATGRGTGARGWTFIIKVPKGTRALPGADYQREVVLSPGVKQRVLTVDKKNRIVYTEVA
jgi:hypothetical protein